MKQPGLNRKEGVAESEFPDDVLDALRANRKIDAIKLLREQRDLGLREAKQLIDAYVAKNAHQVVGTHLPKESKLRPLLLAGLLIAGIYTAYRFLSQ